MCGFMVSERLRIYDRVTMICDPSRSPIEYGIPSLLFTKCGYEWLGRMMTPRRILVVILNRRIEIFSINWIAVD